jgi:predicted metallopeptidase
MSYNYSDTKAVYRIYGYNSIYPLAVNLIYIFKEVSPWQKANR